MKPINLGNKVKDIVTGFTGIASSKVQYLNGCVQFGVRAPVDKDGKMPEAVYIDQEQLVFVSKGVEVNKKDTGGDMPDAPKR